MLCIIRTVFHKNLNGNEMRLGQREHL